MTLKFLMIPNINSHYSAEQIANILWEYNIGKVLTIKIVASKKRVSRNNAYILLIDTHPIIFSLLESGKCFSIQQEHNEIWELNSYVEEDESDINERIISNVSFPSNYFDNKSRASLSLNQT